MVGFVESYCIGQTGLKLTILSQTCKSQESMYATRPVSDVQLLLLFFNYNGTKVADSKLDWAKFLLA